MSFNPAALSWRQIALNKRILLGFGAHQKAYQKWVIETYIVGQCQRFRAKAGIHLVRTAHLGISCAKPNVGVMVVRTTREVRACIDCRDGSIGSEAAHGDTESKGWLLEG